MQELDVHLYSVSAGEMRISLLKCLLHKLYQVHLGIKQL